MRIEDLVREGRVRRQRPSLAQARQAMARAERDLRTARKVLADDWDWGFAIAYDAALQAGRALMLARGYRPASEEGHKNTFAFLEAALGKEHEEIVTYFDRMRGKRHQTIYDVAGRITETEARNLLARAEEFVRFVAARLRATGR